MVGRIKSIYTAGCMIVYRRCWQEPGVRRYVVIRDTDGRVLEAFTRLKTATQFAAKNQNG